MKCQLSNGKAIPFTSRYFGRLPSEPYQAATSMTFRQRLQDQGFLFLRGYLDRQQVLDLRERYFQLFDASFFQSGTWPREGIYSGYPPAGLPAHGCPGHPAHTLVRQACYRAFAGSSRLHELAECLLDGPVRQLRRRPLRHFYRGCGVASRAHTDAAYLESKPDDVVTFWIPLGDCPLSAGGLVYLEDSLGLDQAELRLQLGEPHCRDSRPITDDLKRLADVTGRRWLWADFQAGDLVAHLPSAIHASLDTVSSRMRLSTDIRFTSRDSSVDPRWAQDWAGDDGY